MIKIKCAYKFEKITISLALFCKDLGCSPELQTVCLISENATCNAKVTRDIFELLKASLCSFSPVHFNVNGNGISTFLSAFRLTSELQIKLKSL